MITTGSMSHKNARWQCTPVNNLDLGAQAPVPFIVGVQYKTDEVRSLCGGLVRVNMYKDQVFSHCLH